MALSHSKYFLANLLGLTTGLNTAYEGDVLTLGNGALVGTSIIAKSDFYSQMSHTHYLTHLIASPFTHLVYFVEGYETLPQAIFNVVANNLVPYATDYIHNYIHHDEITHIGYVNHNDSYEYHI